MNFNDPLVKKFLIVIGVLVVLSPLGILLTWNNGDAWGEWGVEDLSNEVHADISGLQSLSDAWSYAPLPDYDIPGWDNPTMASIGYIISAIIGVILSIAIYYALIKIVNPASRQ
ncbi:PDGLE domain-containing protein [Methanothermococcus okinawensis]|uniref:PDGLE domain-containing protein n=1 Tax=Methanothermococcus okinawensis TaxID=155863 RepID=UPI00064F96C4|nr:PDGLE domain-containing protein [Methanothermococcus okinawensis]